MAAIEVKGQICNGPIAKNFVRACSYYNYAKLSSNEQLLHQSTWLSHECCYHSFNRKLQGVNQLWNHKQLLRQSSLDNYAALALAQWEMVPVRYRPNAASGGWSYGHDLASLPWKGKHPLWNGHIISLNIHKNLFAWLLCYDLDCWLFACLARHTANCSAALPEVFSIEIYKCAHASERF